MKKMGLSKDVFIFLVIVCVCLHEFICIVCMQILAKARRGHQIPWLEIIESCELPENDTGNQTQVLWKNSKRL